MMATPSTSHFSFNTGTQSVDCPDAPLHELAPPNRVLEGIRDVIRCVAHPPPDRGSPRLLFASLLVLQPQPSVYESLFIARKSHPSLDCTKSPQTPRTRLAEDRCAAITRS
jgi:hypothetical protein